jgi:hypothetical protein
MPVLEFEGRDLDPTSSDEFLGMFSLGDDPQPVAAQPQSAPLRSMARLWQLVTGELPEDEMEHSEKQVLAGKINEVHPYNLMHIGVRA